MKLTALWKHTPRDRYWGDGGDGTGRNQLGKTLMEVRRVLGAPPSSSAATAAPSKKRTAVELEKGVVKVKTGDLLTCQVNRARDDRVYMYYTELMPWVQEQYIVQQCNCVSNYPKGGFLMSTGR